MQNYYEYHIRKVDSNTINILTLLDFNFNFSYKTQEKLHESKIKTYFTFCLKLSNYWAQLIPTESVVLNNGQ
jgi:hypothetical protein